VNDNSVAAVAEVQAYEAMKTPQGMRAWTQWAQCVGCSLGLWESRSDTGFNLAITQPHWRCSLASASLGRAAGLLDAAWWLNECHAAFKGTAILNRGVVEVRIAADFCVKQSFAIRAYIHTCIHTYKIAVVNTHNNS